MHKPTVQPFLTILLFVGILTPMVTRDAATASLLNAASKQIPGLPSRINNSGVINALMYQRIKPGMTLNQVENIIGFAGIPNPEAAFGAQQAYTWSNPDGSQITVWTRNNRVTIVGKSGLPDIAEAAELDEIPLLSYAIFELIKPGMTVEDVELILGFPGRLEPELSTIDAAQVWRWDDLDGDYIRVYLGEGVVVSKFTSILNLQPTGIVEAEVNAERLQLGMTQATVADILSEGLPYPDPFTPEFDSFIWKYDDGSVLLVVFEENRAIVINPL
ncbi:MAG: hypothetical protein ACLFV6_09135 [Spirulinaceae cyanobacterium]